MCRSMVDIQSATAEIRRGIKKEEDRRKKPQGKNIMSASATQGGHNKYLPILPYGGIKSDLSESDCYHVMCLNIGTKND